MEINLKHFNDYKDILKEKDTFKNNNIFVDICNSTIKSDVDNYMKNIELFDVIIDDHRTKSVLNTFYNFIPYLKENGVYFIEDNK